MALPVAGPAYGLTGEPWAEALIGFIEELEVMRAGSFIPLPGSDDASVLRKPMTQEEFTLRMHEYLVAAGFEYDSIKDIRVHSLKATLLS